MKTTIRFVLMVLLLFEKSGFVFPVSKSGFYETLQNKGHTYVDKTLFLKDILDPCFEEDVLLITMPKRFGKSFNLQMMQKFCEVEVNPDATPVAKNPDDITDTPNYHLFTKEYTFGHLKISQDKEFIRKHLGKYPVAYFDFIPCANQAVNDMNTAISHCGIVIHNAFSLHRYLLKSTIIDDLDKSLVESWISNDYENKGPSHVVNGMQDLIDLLYAHHMKKPIVLVDEFDMFVHSVMAYALPKKVLQKILGFYANIFLTPLKNDKKCRLTVLTGIMHFSSYGMSTGLPGFKMFRFTREEKFSHHYGFTLEEIKELFSRPENYIENINFDEMKKYYNGYDVFGENMYSSYSISQYLKNRRIEPYWADIDSIYYVWRALRLLDIRLKVYKLCNGGCVEMEIVNNKKISIDDIIELQNCISAFEISYASSNQIEIFLNFLLDSGHLKINSKNHTHIEVSAANIETCLDLDALRKKYEQLAATDPESPLEVDIAVSLKSITPSTFEDNIQLITNKLNSLGKLILPTKPSYKEANLREMIQLVCIRSHIPYFLEATVDKMNNPLQTPLPTNAKTYNTKQPSNANFPRKPRTMKKTNPKNELKQTTPKNELSRDKVTHGFVDFIIQNITGLFVVIETKYSKYGTSDTALKQIETEYIGGVLNSEHYKKKPPYNLLMLGIHLNDKKYDPLITISARIVFVKGWHEFGESRTVRCEPET